MNNDELMLENIILKDQIKNQQAKINKFLSYVKSIDIDIPEANENSSILELNLIDNLKDIINECKKMV